MIKNIHPKIKYIFWVVFSITIGISFAFAITKTIGYEKIKNTNTGKENMEAQVIQSVSEKNLEDQNFYFLKNQDKKPNVKAEAYFVGDVENGKMIIEKNSNNKFPIASVSKLMTATVAEENLNQEETTTITQKVLSTYGQNGDFFLNEKIRLGDLIYPMLLESSNDAAEAIASHNNRNSFIKMMNEKAQSLGLVSTTFEDPSGLSINNQSTAFELFKLTKYIKEHRKDIFEKTIKQSYITKRHNWFSTNQFVREKEYEGGKSGYTDPAMQTVVSTFSIPLGENGVRHIAITVLRSPDRKKDVENILTYLKKNVYFGKESDANLAWVKQKENTVEEFEPDFVNLAFVGDIMLDRGVKSSVRKNFGGDYSKLFDNLDILKKADIAFANLEGPASDVGKDMHNLYSFRKDTSTIPALKGAGFDVLSVANNHVGDWGRTAYADTLERLKENEILYAGGGINNGEAEKPTIVEKYGMKIGYLAFSDKGPNAMAVESDKAGLLLASNPRFDEIIKNASNQVNYLIVSFHFGEEYQKTHNERQAYLAHKAIDDGAKIIIGAHPHVVEDFEVYKNSFIAYSLGNFIFDQRFSADTMQGMLLEIKLHKNGLMETTKNIVKLNSSFQPDQIIKGKPERVKFEDKKTI
jgi:poly-gamma-glutamate synthesis protein (capsule biosynthesis protein)